MSIGTNLRVSVSDGIAVISGLNSTTKITLIGASCTASVKPGAYNLDSVTLVPKKGESAVVAVITDYNSMTKGMSLITVGGLILLDWKNGKLFVNKDDDFVSPVDRLGQVHVYEKDLSVTTHGQEFNTARDSWDGIHPDYLAQKRDRLLKKGVRIVDDPTLLCRYLVGQASFEELEAVASGDLRSAEQIRIAEYTNQVGDLVKRLELMVEQRNAFAEHNGSLLSENKGLREDVTFLEAKVTSTSTVIQRQGTLIWSIKDILANTALQKGGRTFWSRTMVKKALAEIAQFEEKPDR